MRVAEEGMEVQEEALQRIYYGDMRNFMYLFSTLCLKMDSYVVYITLLAL